MSNKVIRICAIVIVVLLAVALVAFISINVVRESKKANFYLVHNGTQITENVSDLVLERGTPEKFEIAYFEGLEEEKQEYYVTIECIPGGNNFYFTIQGQESSFYATRSDVTEFLKSISKRNILLLLLLKNSKQQMLLSGYIPIKVYISLMKWIAQKHSIK